MAKATTKIDESGSVRIPFKLHPRVFAALGEDLVTSDVVAVIELVKNAYDAFAIRNKTGRSHCVKLLVCSRSPIVSFFTANRRWKLARKLEMPFLSGLPIAWPKQFKNCMNRSTVTRMSVLWLACAQ